MWKRRDLKKQARQSLKGNRWRCILVALILASLTGSVGSGVTVGLAGGSAAGASQYLAADLSSEQVQVAEEKTAALPATGDAELDAAVEALLEDPAVSESLNQIFSNPEYADLLDALEEMDEHELQIVLLIAGIVVLLIILAAVLIEILIVNPLEVGCRFFFTRNLEEKASLGHVAEGFECGYGRVVKGMFLKDLFLIFWTLLFIIPGLIKSYSYRMVPYILADQPDLGATEAIRRSREMMKGSKWRTFVLDLSFILWWILSALTLGLVGLFYVRPYYQAANAALYRALKGGHALAEPVAE